MKERSQNSRRSQNLDVTREHENVCKESRNVQTSHQEVICLENMTHKKAVDSETKYVGRESTCHHNVTTNPCAELRRKTLLLPLRDSDRDGYCETGRAGADGVE